MVNGNSSAAWQIPMNTGMPQMIIPDNIKITRVPIEHTAGFGMIAVARRCALC